MTNFDVLDDPFFCTNEEYKLFMADLALAENESTSTETLFQLVSKPNPYGEVKCAVARHRNTSPETLVGLSTGDISSTKAISIRCDVTLRGAIAENPNTPPEILDQIAVLTKYGNSDDASCFNVAGNPSTSKDTLLAILANISPFFKDGIIHNAKENLKTK